MAWSDEVCLSVGRSQKGAVWWGALAARDQWTSIVNLDRPKVVRPTDAAIVAALEQGPLTAQMLQAFAQEYRVFHYPLAPKAGRAERLAQVSQALEEVYRSASDTKSGTLADLWWQAILKVRDVLITHGMRKCYLRSFCMKMLWFYYPQDATMWDDYVVRALNARLGTDHRAKVETAEQAAAFLADFERLFARYTESVADALDAIAAISGDRYPFARRVLDKTLWLGGADDQRVIKVVQRLEGDTVSRRAMEQSFPILFA